MIFSEADIITVINSPVGERYLYYCIGSKNNLVSKLFSADWLRRFYCVLYCASVSVSVYLLGNAMLPYTKV